MKTAVEFEKDDAGLVLVYRPRDDSEWVRDKFRRSEELVIKRTFHLRSEDLISEQDIEDEDTEDGFIVVEDDALRFRIGALNYDYYSIRPEVLDLGAPVRIHRDCQITWKWFTAGQATSVFREIAALRPAEIVVGGNAPGAIPEAEFLNLLDRFPTQYELERYSSARVASVVREYVDTQQDAVRQYHEYLGKRLRPRQRVESAPISAAFRELDAEKFQLLHNRLTSMLDSEVTYSEARWQSEILEIVRLLNPKYLTAIDGVPIKDKAAGVNREIDIMLVDASGNVDLIEIKKPFDQSIITANTYRDNHIPLRELSGSIMQIEKYIYYLNRWGAAGEKWLTERFGKQLPEGFKINITNPKGIVIIGRDDKLTSAQLLDFEVVKRKYKNIVDIITYDDLLRRLDFVLRQLQTA